MFQDLPTYIHFGGDPADPDSHFLWVYNPQAVSFSFIPLPLEIFYPHDCCRLCGTSLKLFPLIFPLNVSLTKRLGCFLEVMESLPSRDRSKF